MSDPFPRQSTAAFYAAAGAAAAAVNWHPARRATRTTHDTNQTDSFASLLSGALSLGSPVLPVSMPSSEEDDDDAADVPLMQLERDFTVHSSPYLQMHSQPNTASVPPPHMNFFFSGGDGASLHLDAANTTTAASNPLLLPTAAPSSLTHPSQATTSSTLAAAADSSRQHHATVTPSVTTINVHTDTDTSDYNKSKKDDMFRNHPRRFTASDASASNATGVHELATRMLTKLKSASQQLQARVKRALHIAPAPVGSGGSLTGGGLPASSPSSFDRLKLHSIRRWKEVPLAVREKLLFVLSSLLGTTFFFILFEAVFRVATYNLSLHSEQLFTISYVTAYLISILYQHLLNRMLVFRAAPYCASLCHTYFVYSISLVILTTLGAILIRIAQVNPRFIACGTLPASGVLNYYLLRCLDGHTTAPNGAADKNERGLIVIDSGTSTITGTHSSSSGGNGLTTGRAAIHTSLSHHGVGTSNSLDSAAAATSEMRSHSLQHSPSAPAGAGLSMSSALAALGHPSAAHVTSPYGGRRFTVGFAGSGTSKASYSSPAYT